MTIVIPAQLARLVTPGEVPGLPPMMQVVMVVRVTSRHRCRHIDYTSDNISYQNQVRW
jgi:hypothetical protein